MSLQNIIVFLLSQELYRYSFTQYVYINIQLKLKKETFTFSDEHFQHASSLHVDVYFEMCKPDS